MRGGGGKKKIAEGRASGPASPDRGRKRTRLINKTSKSYVGKPQVITRAEEGCPCRELAVLLGGKKGRDNLLEGQLGRGERVKQGEFTYTKRYLGNRSH